jgi:hypothetical protein
MKTLTTIILTAALLLIMQEFSPLRSRGGDSEPLRLLSPIELQQHINAVLVRYRMEPIKEDGKIGPRTGLAYEEAYSLEQVEQMERKYYEQFKEIEQ